MITSAAALISFISFISFIPFIWPFWGPRGAVFVPLMGSRARIRGLSPGLRQALVVSTFIDTAKIQNIFQTTKYLPVFFQVFLQLFSDGKSVSKKVTFSYFFHHFIWILSFFS